MQELFDPCNRSCIQIDYTDAHTFQLYDPKSSPG